MAVAIDDILAAARTRGTELNLAYAGALTPRESNEVISRLPGSAIVDVRTRAEWDWVGRIRGALLVEWSHYPANVRNPNFLQELAAIVGRDSPAVIFLCRSGHRSHHAAAAAAQAGYRNCFNMLEGFEGDRDARGQRSRVNGWRAAGLPWEQG